MIGRVSIIAALGFGLFAVADGIDPSAPKPPHASVREAIYFGPAGPVRIRLHISIDGRPVDAVWLDAINGLFAFRDRDGDGFLDPSERTPFVPPTRANRDLTLDGASAVQPLRLTFPPKDEKISRAAFAEAVRVAGAGGISFRIVPGRTDSRQLSEALFRLLDQNGDGRLSQDELKMARELLAVLDLDEDEYISAAELLGRSVDAAVGRPRIIPRGGRPSGDSADSTTEMVFLSGEGVQTVKQLLIARGGARATSLKPSEFGADMKKFAELDQDGNGVLDTTELTAWLRQPPDLELSISCDSSSGRLSLLSPAAHTVEKNGTVLATLPGGRFQFEPPQRTLEKEWEQAAANIREEFKKLAKGKGFVERKQLESMPPLLAFFEFADRNADGKVETNEVEAALKALAQSARCRFDIAFEDQGNGLFELLDRNGDGRLSPRELVEAAAVLKPFAGPDGTIGPKDILRRFQVRCNAEPIPIGVLVPPTQLMPALEIGPPISVPAWFTKMDRNGDGDVSLREFVGPIELFRKLDKNGDGLISPEEAIAADK